MVIPIVVGLLFFAIGILILISGIASFIKRRKQIANSLSATGVVTAFVTEMGRSGYLYYPQVQFKVADGQTITFQSSVGSSRADYGVGQQVKVLYDAHHPQQAEIEAPSSLWLVPGCMTVIGIAFVIIGLLLSLIMFLVVR